MTKKNIDPIFLCLVILIPLISFWYLDAFFLFTEKLYREMYKWVIAERPKGNADYMYDLNPHRFKDIKNDKGKKVTIGSVMRSITLRYFYGIPIIMTIIIMSFLLFSDDAPFKKGKREKKISSSVISVSPSTTKSKVPALKAEPDDSLKDKVEE